MTEREFVKAAVNSGYADERTARRYCAARGKDAYGASDFIGVYHADRSNRISLQVGRACATSPVGALAFHMVCCAA